MGYMATALDLGADAEDRATTLADLRAASCLAEGIDPEDIDPARGCSISERSYLRSRGVWADLLARTGSVPARSEVHRAFWEQRRPQFLAAHPWPQAT